MKNLKILFPDELIKALAHLQSLLGKSFYFSGGTVRDCLLSRHPSDLDITVESGAVDCCHALIKQLGEGAFVMLGTETEEAARVVWRGNGIDFSSFRQGAQTIEEDLANRDFTINAMAVPFSGGSLDKPDQLIDPLGGMKDLRARVLSKCPQAFVNDPLRMLRGYRLSAELGFTLDDSCSTAIKKYSHRIANVAAERIHYELDRIMMTGNGAKTFKDMSTNNLLWQLLPELRDGHGMEQPGFHHEDVFHHNLLALQCIEEVMAEPERFFIKELKTVSDYLQSKKRRNSLRWSALFHDLGKPATHSSGTIKSGRITFYNHDQVGRQIFERIATRLRWSRTELDLVGRLIEMHMYPFHLCNVRRGGKVSRKACLRICKKAGEELPGLFVLAMADSLAGQGEQKPENMEMELAQLYAEIQSTNQELIQPLLQGKRLLTGHDLVAIFKLDPGPEFSKIFSNLEIAMVEERVKNRDEALLWVEEYLKKY